jgi:uncharacterized protein (DUF305 family)
MNDRAIITGLERQADGARSVLAELSMEGIEIPSFMTRGKKSADVPFITHMRVSFFATAQDIAAQILSSDDEEEVKRLATELYELAGKYL